MNENNLDQIARALIEPDSDLVRHHLEYLKEMVRIDSRSFGVNEFIGDRKTPSDMREILSLAKEYLKGIGFSWVKVNESHSGTPWKNPILMAEITAGEDKPTVLCYAHLDKQPYMDSGDFAKWGGVPPTELRWNEDRSRAYGRGAADDLAGVTAIGLAVDALLRAAGCDSGKPSPDQLVKLPCNFKIIYETEEESGSHTLIEQIEQNHDFFASSDCVIITDVINPAQGVPGLTTSLRGIIQCEVELALVRDGGMDAQTALYKLVATLIDEHHALAVKAIAAADLPLTEEEHQGYCQVPTTVEFLRQTAGLLPSTRLTVPEDRANIIKAQLRKSFANVRPGHRVSGSVIFGAAGARLTFKTFQGTSKEQFRKYLEETFRVQNRFNLKLILRDVENVSECAFDLILQSADQDPHSGVHGGPFPIAELQIAQMINRLIDADGLWNDANAGDFLTIPRNGSSVTVQSLFVDHRGFARPFSDSAARAIVEIRLAPGNEAPTAISFLCDHLHENTPAGFELKITEDKGASPWITQITHPVFPIILEALETGYRQKPCLYGCGGSIPFVPKLTQVLGGIPPLCLGAYDPDSKIHEPGESLSVPDWLGCGRSIVRFATRAANALSPHPSPKKQIPV
ncbi:MAG: M20/M25/M40 family metallo-hydrolase [Nitrospinota bacterium]|nr:M20/M25/M40 family metallo-hydrolase [Nitrospinota bacterium]